MPMPEGGGLHRVLFYGLLAAGLSFVSLGLLGYVDDDAYIHFRIAENLLQYGVPYFNPDEPVMASSSSGWTVFLFLVFSVVGAKLKTLSVINSLITCALVYVSARLIDRAAGRKKLLHDGLAAAAVLPVTLVSSAGLMETPLALLVLISGILMYAKGDRRSFVLLGAGVFFRLELAVFLVLFLLHAAYKDRLLAWKPAAFAALGALPFVCYNLYFFGTNLPLTVKAKSVIYSLDIQTFLVNGIPPLHVFPGRLVELCLLLVLLVLLLYYSASERDAPTFMLAAGGAGIFLSYLLKRVFVFSWYQPLYLLPLFLGGSILIACGRARPLLPACLAASLPVLLAFYWNVYAAAWDKCVYRNFPNGARVSKYLEVSRRLYGRYPGCTLMSSEIGGLGYGFRGRIYDGVGLISPGALKYHPMKVPGERSDGGLGAIPAGYVREVRPDIIVTYEMLGQALMASDAVKDYRVITEDIFLKDDLARQDVFWGGKKLFVLIRKDKYRGY